MPFKCSKCGEPLKTTAIHGNPIVIAGCQEYYPIKLLMGCPDCYIIIGQRHIIVNPKNIKNADEGVER